MNARTMFFVLITAAIASLARLQRSLAGRRSPIARRLGTTRELDTAAMRRARLFVDRRESCLNEAGDFLLAKKEGAIGDEHILGELGEVFLGRVPGRTSANDVTLFKSLGIAVEDLAAAHLIWRKAEATNAGTSIEFGGKSIAV